MADDDKTKRQLIDELAELRQRVAMLETQAASSKAIETEQQRDRLHAILQVIFECFPFDFFAIGLDGRYMMQNRVSKMRWGEAIGKCPEDVAGEANLAVWLENNRRAFAGEKVEQEVVLDVHGEQRFYQNVVVPIRDGEQIYGILGVNVDVTRRKQAEEALKRTRDELERQVEERTAALRDANQKLVTTLERITDGFVSLDWQWHYTYINEAATHFIRKNREELLGDSAADMFSQTAPPKFLREVTRAVEENTAVHFEEFYPEPLNIWFECHVYPSAEGLTVYFRDVTERKRAQEALQRQHRTLEHMLRASDHERQLIAYDIHDGLAQQLAGAIMQLQVYDHLKPSRPDEAQKAYDGGVTLLRQAHFEARRLISGVRPPILDESGILAAIAHLVNEQSFQGGPEITFRSNVKFRRLAAVEENAIYRIVQEALANASKHSKSKMVQITLRQRGQRVCLQIQDWGVGFDLKTVRRNRFGLAGVRERARLLGGKCRIDSKPNQGTRIVVELPLAERETDG
jgi:PAS domain S-box-containing protein